MGRQTKVRDGMGGLVFGTCLVGLGSGLASAPVVRLLGMTLDLETHTTARKRRGKWWFQQEEEGRCGCVEGVLSRIH